MDFTSLPHTLRQNTNSRGEVEHDVAVSKLECGLISNAHTLQMLARRAGTQLRPLVAAPHPLTVHASVQVRFRSDRMIAADLKAKQRLRRNSRIKSKKKRKKRVAALEAMVRWSTEDCFHLILPFFQPSLLQSSSGESCIGENVYEFRKVINARCQWKEVEEKRVAALEVMVRWSNACRPGRLWSNREPLSI